MTGYHEIDRETGISNRVRGNIKGGNDKIVGYTNVVHRAYKRGLNTASTILLITKKQGPPSFSESDIPVEFPYPASSS